MMTYMVFQPSAMMKKFDPNPPERKARIHNTRIYKNLDQHLPLGTELVINANEFEDVDIMFYNPGLAAQHYVYSPEKMDEFRKKGIKIAAFPSRPGYDLPE